MPADGGCDSQTDYGSAMKTRFYVAGGGTLSFDWNKLGPDLDY